MAKKPALTPEEARAEALGTALSTIERKYGKGAVPEKYFAGGSHSSALIIRAAKGGLSLGGGLPLQKVEGGDVGLHLLVGMPENGQ